MQNYDPDLMKEYANSYLKRAQFLVPVLTILGVLVGAFYGFEIGQLGRYVVLYTIIGGLVAGLFFFVVAKIGAVRLKLRAQQALCLAEIEKNSREGKPVNDELKDTNLI